MRAENGSLDDPMEKIMQAENGLLPAVESLDAAGQAKINR